MPIFHAGRWRARGRRLPHRVEVAVALLAAGASLAPSLLPKTVLVQGLVTGIAAAAGYGAGALLVVLASPLRQRVPARLRDRCQRVLLAVAALALVPAAVASHVWQRELSAALGMAGPSPASVVAALFVAAAVAAALVLVGRAFRAAVRWIAGRLTPLLPRMVAVTLAAVLVAGLVVTVGDRLLRQRLFDAVDRSLRAANLEAAPERPAPPTPLRSGGPGSLVAWEDLGRFGREFVSLPAVRGGVPPIRVYAGLRSAADLRQRAELVVAELERTGAFQRGVVCVVVPTGSGGINPDAVLALEALWDGDTAVASMQYSYLPSVLAQLTDRERTETAARALIDAVVRRFQAMPDGFRPQLVLYGESLGSTGVEAALLTVPGAWEEVDGVLLVGPPNTNPLWSRLVARREPGSPLLAPVVEGGRQVRFWPGPEIPDRHRTGGPWPEPASGPRILYLQHPSDPVVWWSPSLLWSPPPWLDEREIIAGAPPLRWRPVVTFWQVTGDLLFAAGVPPGHGHRYRVRDLTAAWAVIAPVGR
ncbi:MAG TPA: alpha/beta-hydrolase family protein [Natronosporangium sp.]|nr:alpha/beta-hydrolase family protein [Natronosporangium sp.]